MKSDIMVEEKPLKSVMELLKDDDSIQNNSVSSNDDEIQELQKR
jgi:hypothetical protein